MTEDIWKREHDAYIARYTAHRDRELEELRSSVCPSEPQINSDDSMDLRNLKRALRAARERVRLYRIQKLEYAESMPGLSRDFSLKLVFAEFEVEDLEQQLKEREDGNT